MLSPLPCIHHLLLAISLLPLFLPLTTQVNIVLEWWSEGMSYFDQQISIRCDNTPPGACCKPHPESLLELLSRHAGGVTFYHLRHNQFGAGWPAAAASWMTSTNHPTTFSCSGRPLVRVFGPAGGWDDSVTEYGPPWDGDVDGTPETVVYAAAWIDLRTRFPPNSAGSRYLQWQGVKGAVWGRDTWSVASDGIPFPKRKRESVLDGYLGAERGVVNVSAPTRWVYPNVYVVNGTEYVSGGVGEYASKNGTVLDLKALVAR